MAERGIAARSALLGLVVLGVYALAAPVAGWISGAVGLAAAAAAAACCLLGAQTALLASYLLRGPAHALHAMAVAMAARLVLPLVLALLCRFHGGPLADAGLLYYLVVFYLAALGTETALSLPYLRQPAPDRSVAKSMTS